MEKSDSRKAGITMMRRAILDGIVIGCPTSGKTSLKVAMLKQGRSYVDTDDILACYWYGVPNGMKSWRLPSSVNIVCNRPGNKLGIGLVGQFKAAIANIAAYAAGQASRAGSVVVTNLSSQENYFHWLMGHDDDQLTKPELRDPQLQKKLRTAIPPIVFWRPSEHIWLRMLMRRMKDKFPSLVTLDRVLEMIEDLDAIDSVIFDYPSPEAMYQSRVWLRSVELARAFATEHADLIEQWIKQNSFHSLKTIEGWLPPSYVPADRIVMLDYDEFMVDFL